MYAPFHLNHLDLYITLSQPIRGWSPHLRFPWRLFYLLLPIQLILKPCSYSITLIRVKTQPFCSQSVTWKRGNNPRKHSVYLSLFSLVWTQLAGSRHGPPLLFSHVDCDDFTALRLILSLSFFIMSWFPSDIFFITEAMSCRLSSLGWTQM